MSDPLPTNPAQFRPFALAAAGLTLVFMVPLWRLCSFAAADDLYSFIPLMPLVSLYLAWTNRAEFPCQSSPARPPARLFLLAGAAAAAGYTLLTHSSPAAGRDFLGLAVIAWLLCLAGAGCWFLGGAAMRAMAFPFFLLCFMIPFPGPVRTALETALQNGSAAVADWMFTLAGTPFWRGGTLIRLPDITLQVAPECSGIHSTWILLITSLVAGRMMLRRPWNRALLFLAILPLALLRNGFRVFVIGELCVHVGPRMIDSPIHHRGGPLFFALSLVPFFLLLYFLKKREVKSAE